MYRRAVVIFLCMQVMFCDLHVCEGHVIESEPDDVPAHREDAKANHSSIICASDADVRSQDIAGFNDAVPDSDDTDCSDDESGNCAGASFFLLFLVFTANQMNRCGNQAEGLPPPRRRGFV